MDDYRGSGFDKLQIYRFEPREEPYPELSIFDQPFYLVETDENNVSTYLIPGAPDIKIRIGYGERIASYIDYTEVKDITLTLNNEEIDLVKEFRKLEPELRIRTSKMGGDNYDHNEKAVQIVGLRNLRDLWGLFHEARHAAQYAHPEIINLTNEDLRAVTSCYFAKSSGSTDGITLRGLDAMLKLEQDAHSNAEMWFSKIIDSIGTIDERDRSVLNYMFNHYLGEYEKWIEEVRPFAK